ncbi:unnamed protein product [Arctogadus glacialis]
MTGDRHGRGRTAGVTYRRLGVSRVSLFSPLSGLIRGRILPVSAVHGVYGVSAVYSGVLVGASQFEACP